MLRRALLGLALAVFATGPVLGCDTSTTTLDPPLPSADGGTDASGASCRSDSDCADPAKKKCDTASNTCQACIPGPDTCASGAYCGKESGGSYGCLPGCKTDPDCAGLADAGAGDAGADGGSAPSVTPACCDHVCSNTAGDAKNCGTCGNACGAGAACCNSACLDTKSTLANCGGCGTTCAPANAAVAQCAAGVCGYTACTAPFNDCDLNKANGCESNPSTDVNNCGACGTKCGAGQGCSYATCCGPNEVGYNGKCYYLDGSGGACDAGFARAAESVLAVVASRFAGKNYKHTVSDNCCVWTSDPLEHYGMVSHCSTNGPFSAGEPALGGGNCVGLANQAPAQLTFCGN